MDSLFAIHSIHLFLHSRNTKVFRTEVNLQGIRAKLVFCKYCFHTFSHMGFKGVIIKQAFTSAQATMLNMPNTKFLLAFLPVS